MKGLDTHYDKQFSDIYADGAPCADCGHAAEEHDQDDETCAQCLRYYGDESEVCCELYRPADPRDYAPDGWED